MSDLIMLGAINKLTKKYIHPNQANKKDEYICVECGKDVIIRKGNIRVHHFAHCKEDEENRCNFYNKPTESQIHKTAKLLLKNILYNKIKLIIHRKCNKCNKNDEYEIPEITDNSLIEIEHRFEYNGLKIADVAYIEDNKILCIFEICYKHRTESENRPEPWFEFDAVNLIETFNICDLKSINLYCIRYEKCDECYCKENIIEEQMNDGIIYFNQRGAGCGKTYESIQLIQNDERFIEKDIYIYLTKMSSAKDVIKNEFEEQEASGSLNLLEIIENNPNGNQYKITCLNKNTNKEITVIIGTIDSFNYAVADKEKIIKTNDYFKGLVKTIRNGFTSIKNNKINYAGKSRSLNKNCLIVVDEAQDLGPEYIEAFNTIINQTSIDVYVIGDKLQSIWGEHNIHTYIDVNNLKNTIVERSYGINKVMRFHNEKFKQFVNGICSFEKYGLPPITEICDGCCKYSHENNIIPYNLFEVPKIYSNDYDYEKIDKVVEYIISKIDEEVNKYNYLPNNFMFIFPILSKNVFAQLLETRIQKYWIEKFNNINYQEKVLKNSDYWKDKTNDDNFYKYVYLHKSDLGSSINLKESENSTRILSIHSSKGNGCEVVFLLGVTEDLLTKFSKQKCNLVYDSLLHVALTRQKKTFYMGIEKNNDDIYNRFKNFGINENLNIIPSLETIKIFNKFTKLEDYVNNNDEIFTNINIKIIEPNNYINLLPKSEKKNKTIIDLGHHMIRRYVMHYNFMCNIILNERIENKSDQFITILKKISQKTIRNYKYFDYNNKLRIIDNNNKFPYTNKGLNTEIPLLLFNTSENTQYYKYTFALNNIMVNIQNKIRDYIKINKLPPLCPIESVILFFMIKIINRGSYSEISIMDIYSIMYYYDSCIELIDEEHTTNNKCICHNCFNGKNFDNKSKYKKIKSSIKNHYEYLENIRELYNNYKKYNLETLNIKNMTYNIDHLIYLGKNNKNFTFSKEYTIIAHSDEKVIYFIIKPQFNELNFNNIMCESILNNYMILNCDPDSDNYKRYNNKEIYTCILTLDSVEPIFYKLNIDKNNILMKEIVKKYLLYTYTNNNELIYNFYQYCYKNKPKNKSSINYTIENLNKYSNLPKYIYDFFNLINAEIEACDDDISKIKKVMNKVNDKELFNNKLNICLEKGIDEFLEMNVDDDTIIDY